MAALIDLLLPRPCPCGAAGGPVCVDCCRQLAGTAARLVRPYPAPIGLPTCAAAAAYRGSVRRLLIAYKERGRRDVGRVLAQGLAAAVRAIPALQPGGRGDGREVVLVPVPASRAGFRTRGVDHVATLVRLAAARLGQQVGDVRRPVRWVPLLEPTRRVADQSGLSGTARAINVAHSLRVRSRAGWSGRESSIVVLVDDVLTTGATLAEAARALRAGGIQPAGAAVVAAAERRDVRRRTTPVTAAAQRLA